MTELYFSRRLGAVLLMSSPVLLDGQGQEVLRHCSHTGQVQEPGADAARASVGGWIGLGGIGRKRRLLER
ncbi:hypothetical protein [Kineococcus terrestris]|uniref:hypothetical protein n=1 Tax=Kineococcus terrestris TaxID=2044856 RepID=UPI0034DB6773